MEEKQKKLTNNIINLYSFVKNVFFEEMDQPSLMHRVTRKESAFLQRQGIQINMLNTYVYKTIFGYVDEYFKDCGIIPKTSDNYTPEQKNHLIDLNKNMDMIKEKTVNLLYERFSRLSSQEKPYIEIVVNLENAINKIIRSTNNSIESIDRQIVYFMLLYDYKEQGFNKYRFLSSNDACTKCKEYGKNEYLIDELMDSHFLPIAHPNCRCSIEIIDDKNRGVAIIDEKSVEEHLHLLGISQSSNFSDYLQSVFFSSSIMSSIFNFVDLVSIPGYLIRRELEKLLLDKTFHKLVWLIGAETYLKSKKYYTSAEMLKHSLLKNPPDIYMGNSSRTAGLIKMDKSFLSELDKKIASSNGKELEDTISIKFLGGDLYYSIHKADIKIKGHKMDNDKWKIYGTLDDEYDYTQIMSFMEGNYATLGTIANDAAVISQLIGAISPYHIYINFELER